MMSQLIRNTVLLVVFVVGLQKNFYSIKRGNCCFRKHSCHT
jgi:hypothetical protein